MSVTATLNSIGLKEKFYKEYGRQPDLIVRAPGRINLIGEHTDYNGGFALPAAIDKYMYFAASRNNDAGTIRIVAADIVESALINIKELKKSDQSWVNYICGIIHELTESGHILTGMDVMFSSTIPAGAGLSSSAALDCAILRILLEVNTIKMSPWDQVRLTQRSNNQYLGVKSGILDQSASIFGLANHALKLDCHNQRFEAIPLTLDTASLLLINTNVTHDHTNSGYNDRATECHDILDILRKLHPHLQSLSDVTAEILNESDKILKKQQLKRVGFILEENQRVHKFCDAMSKSNLKLCGKLLSQSHEGLRTKYEVSCEELDLLVELSLNEEAVYGARMMGGGFGGCVLLLIATEKLISTVKRICRHYKEISQKEPSVYHIQIVNGVEVIDIS